MAKQVGKFRAKPFTMNDAEELESMLFSSGASALGMGSEGYIQDFINAVLMLAASPASKERFGRFVTEMWQHPLQEEIEDAEDEDKFDVAGEKRAQKRKLYRRAAPTARNEILNNLFEQKAFKDFLSGYLSMLPTDLADQIRGGITEALAGMKSQVTKSNASTESEESTG